jgi:hypothetical protein
VLTKNLISSAVLFAVPVVCASAVPSEFPVAPAVSYVQTGGYWELNGHSGRYRVVLATGGFEHITTHIRFEWVQAPEGEAGEQRISRTVVLQEVLLGVASVTSFSPDAKGVTVAFDGETHDGAKYVCRVILRPAGLYSKSAGC